jgi:hypothetical protein
VWGGLSSRHGTPKHDLQFQMRPYLKDGRHSQWSVPRTVKLPEPKKDKTKDEDSDSD